MDYILQMKVLFPSYTAAEDEHQKGYLTETYYRMCDFLTPIPSDLRGIFKRGSIDMKKKRKDFIHNFSPAFLLILCLATGLSGLTACSGSDASKDAGNESQESADTDADQKKKR